jgi:signal recognition particle receptor subunit beta
MAALNPLTRELVFKIVFYGPGLGGKTTTLQAIHERTKPEQRGKLVSLATPTERTLYFDFLPVRLPRIRDLNVRLQLFTVPGQVYFSATRKLVLTGADGIVFVADSQLVRMDANQESLEDLSANLAEHGRSLSQIPHTFQWNKRDIADAASEGELDRRFNLFAAPTTPSIALRGVGVFDSLEKITRLVVEAYKARIPREVREDAIAALDPDDLGIEEAVRELAESDRVPGSVRGTRTSDRHSDAMQTTLPKSGQPLSAHSPLPPTHSYADAGIDVGSSKRIPSVTDVAVTASPPPPAPEGSLSFAEMWPADERNAVRRAEASLASGDYTGVALACDVLVARVLASGAALAGTLEAPRDPGMVVLLLGLEGLRYLAFRTTVRAARNKETVTAKAATECFLFALEARRARSAIG